MLVSDPLSRELVSSRDVADALVRPARLDALERSRLLDSEPEEVFDRAARLACRLLSAPVGLVSLVTPERQFFKAQVGLDELWATQRGTPLSHSFCQYVVATRGAFVVNDASTDPLVRESPAVSELGVRAYLGVPLRETDGEVLGALCAIDTDPREWLHDDVETLQDVASCLGTEIALRLRLEALHKCEAALRERHEETLRLSREFRHHTGNLLAIVTAVMNLSARLSPDVPGIIAGLASRVAALSRAHTAFMEADPREADLAILLRSIVGTGPRVKVESGERVVLPSRAVTSIGLIVHEWMNEIAGTAAEGRLAWRREGRELHLCWNAPNRPRSPCPLRTVLVEAAAEQLDARIFESEDGEGATLVAPLAAA